MSVLGFIAGLASTVVSAVGTAISATASFIATKLPVVFEKAASCVSMISTVVTKVSEVLNIAPPNENPAELGAKTLQEDTRPRKAEESAQEYLDYLRNEVELDRDKFEKMSKEEKLGCEIVGDSMIAHSIGEKTNVDISGEFLLAIPQANLKSQTVLNLIKSFSESGISSMDDFVKYISNNMSEGESQNVGEAVKVAIKEGAPEMSPEEIHKEIVDMKREFNTKK